VVSQNEPTVTASMLVLQNERTNGNYFEGKADVNQNPEAAIAEQFMNIIVGDCARDNKMPSFEQRKQMSENKQRRDMLAGKNIDRDR